MSQGRRIAYLIMLCLIAKHLMSDSYGPLDRFLEIGVFLLIAYEVYRGVSKSRKSRKRKDEIKSRVATMFVQLVFGQELQRLVPPATATELVVNDWVESVKKWMAETQDILRSYTAQAAAAFLHNPGTMILRYTAVSDHAHERYLMLIQRVNNLKSIMEKPDVYF
jgi:hypothetical protein